MRRTIQLAYPRCKLHRQLSPAREYSFPNMVVLRLLRLARMSDMPLVCVHGTVHDVHTGGCSSTFSPLSGFALRLANTPSLPVPPPYTRPITAGANTGVYVDLDSTTAGLPSPAICVALCSVDEIDGVPLISLCLSSPSLSSSLSDPSASNVSARF